MRPLQVGLADNLWRLGLKPKEYAFVVEYTKDFDARRAAAASGYAPDTGYQLRDKEHISTAVEMVLQHRLEQSHIDAEWLLWELVDNHMIARAQGKLTASNTALHLIGKHGKVDAFAAEKVVVATDKDVMDRLERARRRAAGVPLMTASANGNDAPATSEAPPVSFF